MVPRPSDKSSDRAAGRVAVVKPMEREQIRAAVQKLDVVTAPRVVAALQSVNDALPDLFEPRIDLVIAAIKEQQKAERQKWLERP